MEIIKSKLQDQTGIDSKNKELLSTHKFELVMSQNKETIITK